MDRSRVKQYGDTVFLKNGQHFEIELFNPKSTQVLAKISLNGRSISSSGIVLKPGQRVFLERFLDEARRFMFETYDVENSKEALAAIENNGEVKVEFFNERPALYVSDYVYAGPAYSQPKFTTNLPNTWSVSNSTGLAVGITNTASLSVGGTTVNYCSQPVAGSIETGRVEVGEKSNQVFSQYSGSFNWFPDQVCIIKLKPASAKPLEVGEIRNYCTNCSTRIKKSTWKFCPSCGTQIND